MATKTRKIPQNSWDHHKETILNLYLNDDYSTAKLVQAMKEDHGFSATVSQFEAQFKVWKVRKNLKSHEWKAVFDKLDHMSSPQNSYRISISGHPVSMDKIHRAKRYLKGERPQSKRRRREPSLLDSIENEAASDVLIEVQGLDGEWTPYTVATENDTSTNELQEVNTRTQDLESSDSEAKFTPDDTSGESPRTTEYSEPYNISPQLSFSEYDFTFNEPFPVEMDQFFPQPMDFELIEPLCPTPPPFVFHGPVTPSSQELTKFSQRPSNLAQFSLYTPSLKDLPFEQLENEFKRRGLSLKALPSPMQDCRLLSGSHKLSSLFINEAVDVMANTNARTLRENFYSAGLTLRTLETIIPGAQQDCENNGMAGALQATAEVELHRLLLCSAANGFIGMNDVPIATALRFLDNNSNATWLLSRFLKGNKSPVAKSLTENLFRAAIESCDHEKTRFFLQTGLVDVNSTLCHIEGKKYTPLERAALLQGFKVVHELLKHNPDPNQTYLEHTPNTGDWDLRRPLGCLIKAICPEDGAERNHSTFSPEYLDAVDALVKAGASIQYQCVNAALKRFVRMDLARRLLQHSAPTDHSDFIERGILAHIADEIDGNDAEKAINKIISDCQQTGCNQCLSRFPTEMEWAAINGARRGHAQLVKTLFQYVKSPTRILSAAIMSGNRELREFILAKKPDIRGAPAEIIERFSMKIATTPLAEAIEAEDSELVKILEREGALENTRQERCFEAVVSASVKVGNFDYLKVLFSEDFPRPSIMALFRLLPAAVETEKEEIVQLLLDLTTHTATYSNEASTVLTEAYTRGNKAILSRLMAFHPKLKIFGKNDHISRDLKSGNWDMINYFHESSRLSVGALGPHLIIAIEKDDIAMLRRLLKYGASPIDNDALELAVREHPHMVPILLEHISSRANALNFYGTEAVKEAIRQSPESMDILDMLLSCKAINLDTRERSGDIICAPFNTAIEKDAASSGLDFPLTKRFLNVGRDINGIIRRDKERSRQAYITPLLAAIKTRNKDLVQFLIRRGANVNQDATNGLMQTPLQAAAAVGSLDIVNLLIQETADINAQPANLAGATALQYAAMSGNCNIAALLLDRGASLDAPPAAFYGRYPLEGAAEFGRLDMIQFLWNVSIVGFPTQQCRKAVRLAEANGHGACKDLIRNLAVLSGSLPTIEGVV
ncbi:ankyrin [Hypoxylon trugodes]|uniref:ankyrin n=1 Tax=Hypoxylon trugodes TaxID=326681 RepID=UPI00218FB108|nr:ankyrin [Hypoxylon trugodes]KAI1390847.1 ankyrin [Hypoxylon trugodes]